KPRRRWRDTNLGDQSNSTNRELRKPREMNPLSRIPRISRFLIMTAQTETQVRLFASAQSWIEGEAVRQLYATAKFDGVRLAVGFPDLHPGKGTPIGAAFVTEGVI